MLFRRLYGSLVVQPHGYSPDPFSYVRCTVHDVQIRKATIYAI
jgi:hypothetical protein